MTVDLRDSLKQLEAEWKQNAGKLRRDAKAVSDRGIAEGKSIGLCIEREKEADHMAWIWETCAEQLSDLLGK